MQQLGAAKHHMVFGALNPPKVWRTSPRPHGLTQMDTSVVGGINSDVTVAAERCTRIGGSGRRYASAL